MIGLTLITQLVYWYRDLRTPGLAVSGREIMKLEMKQTRVPTSQVLSVIDNLTPYEVPRTDIESSDNNKMDVQECFELNLNDVGFPECPESNSNYSAIRNSELMEWYSYGGGSTHTYSKQSALSRNDNALENPDRMEWNSYDSGVRLSENPEWITNELSNSELPELGESSFTQSNNDDERRRRWERNEIDYMGQDSFQNVLAKLQSSLND